MNIINFTLITEAIRTSQECTHASKYVFPKDSD